MTGEGMFTSILCPIDGSECAAKALDIAAQLAAEQKAKLTICTVVDPSRAAAMAFGDATMSAACFEALEDEAKTLAADALERVKNVAKAEVICLDGQPIEKIVEYALAKGCDLIVIGSHGRSGIRRALLGSVAEGVLHKAHAPVMIIRWTHAAVAGTRVNGSKATAVT
jgi:nucleotide-binding universal stress UspA family protein